MAGKAKESFEMPDGRKVGYHLTERKGYYRVRYVRPDGKRVEVAMGCATKNDAYTAAA